MSWWTYVRGTIYVDVPGRTQPEIEYILKTVLDHLPVVTGSENDMEVHFVKRAFYSCSSSCDEFGMRTNNLKDDYGSHSRRHGMLDVQSQYILVLDGSLRDREFEETKREFIKWLCRLSKRLFIADIMVEISSYKKSWVIKDTRGFCDMHESPSWADEGSIAWWEYLMWDRCPGTDVPLQIASKLWDYDVSNEEMKRRRKFLEDVEDGD